MLLLRKGLSSCADIWACFIVQPKGEARVSDFQQFVIRFSYFSRRKLLVTSVRQVFEGADRSIQDVGSNLQTICATSIWHVDIFLDIAIILLMLVRFNAAVWKWDTPRLCVVSGFVTKHNLAFFHHWMIATNFFIVVFILSLRELGAVVFNDDIGKGASDVASSFTHLILRCVQIGTASYLRGMNWTAQDPMG